MLQEQKLGLKAKAQNRKAFALAFRLLLVLHETISRELGSHGDVIFILAKLRENMTS
jgi:hypothetical protein